MAGRLRGVGSGIVVGLGLVGLGQQFGVIDLGPTSGLIPIALGAGLGGLLFGLLGHRLGGRARREGVQAWSSVPAGAKRDAPDTSSGR